MEQPVAKIKVDERILAKIETLRQYPMSILRPGDIITLCFDDYEDEWRRSNNPLFASCSAFRVFSEWMRVEYPEAFI